VLDQDIGQESIEPLHGAIGALMRAERQRLRSHRERHGSERQ
jgi:hypothetical protein